MSVVALIRVFVGLLGVTVPRPPTHWVSSVVPPIDLITTCGDVLSIVKDDVMVMTTSRSGAPMTLGIGTTQDVKGWIGDTAYTEVIGMESDRTKLKAKSYDAIGPSRIPLPTPIQSDAQSGVQFGTQPLVEPSLADLVQQLAFSDIWFEQASDEGIVNLELENIPSGRSAFVVSTTSPNDLTLTLIQKIEQTSTLVIVAPLTACIFALIILAFFLARWQSLRLCKIREARIRERHKTGSLETSPINSVAVAERIAAACEAAPAAVVVSEPAKTDESSVEESEQCEADADDQHVDNVPVQGAAAFASGKNKAGDDEAPVAGADEIVAEDSVEAEPADRAPVDPAEASDDNAEQARPIADISEEYIPDPPTDTFECRDRHGLGNGLIDQDPPERATTDTGVIDLSGIRGGHALSSHRVLRETRSNGEQVVAVDGQEFGTGLIPMTRPRATEQAPTPTVAPDDDVSSTGGWTPIMSGWLKDRQEGK